MLLFIKNIIVHRFALVQAALISGIILFAIGCDPVDIGSGNAGGLIGTWISECTATSGSKFEIETLIFDNNKVNDSFDEYDDSTCSGEPNKISVDRDYKIGDELTTDSGKTAREIDLTFRDSTIYYDIYSIENNNLFFGSNYSTNVDSRPTELSNFAYKRQ